MKAAIYHAYGPPEVLSVGEMDPPVPKAGEVLVKVIATTVTSGDCRIRSFKDAGIYWLPMRLLFGIFRPRNPVPGMEFCGQVIETGALVCSFAVGEYVFGVKVGGANAEFVSMSEKAAIARKPETLTFEQAAAVPFGALAAYSFVRNSAQLKAGQRVLIYGASGAVGVFAIQISKILGAHVTAVCSTKNLRLVKELGADVAIDYTISDFSAEGSLYDVILDTVGQTSFSRCRASLTARGRHVFAVQRTPQLFQALFTLLSRGRRVICGISRDTQENLELIKQWIDVGLLKPVIDRKYSLDDVRAAHRYVETGRKRGAVVLNVEAS